MCVKSCVIIGINLKKNYLYRQSSSGPLSFPFPVEKFPKVPK